MYRNAQFEISEKNSMSSLPGGICMHNDAQPQKRTICQTCVRVRGEFGEDFYEVISLSSTAGFELGTSEKCVPDYRRTCGRTFIQILKFRTKGIDT